jgi:hypothetical protein
MASILQSLSRTIHYSLALAILLFLGYTSLEMDLLLIELFGVG